ncbi:hypothetical protein ACFCX0_46505 [Streptomyces sp. NPDC056352]|uniref:hypothetical protein n=1 Tax=Streptomyces sp. NPDC056352 TaxID=3345791 RepID=UPI0035E1ACB8
MVLCNGMVYRSARNWWSKFPRTKAMTLSAATSASSQASPVMPAAGGKLGRTAHELAPAYLSDQEATDTVLARYADGIGCAVDTILATRRYALTGDRRALEGTWI